MVIDIIDDLRHHRFYVVDDDDNVVDTVTINVENEPWPIGIFKDKNMVTIRDKSRIDNIVEKWKRSIDNGNSKNS